MTYVSRKLKAYKLVMKYFKNDNQTQIWFIIRNPSLGNMKPIDWTKSKHLYKCLCALIERAL